VFTGVTLFIGDVGRLDVDGHANLRGAYESLAWLRNLPDYFEVHHAHYAGSDCASNSEVSFNTVSTTGFEREYNRIEDGA
jgi:hydroxyacylglutathione hydrolase